MIRWNKPPDEGWWRFGLRRVLLAILRGGAPGDEFLPARGWLRRAAIAYYVALGIVVVGILAALIAQN